MSKSTMQRRREEDEDEPEFKGKFYTNFIRDHEKPWCWLCGRADGDRPPAWWLAPNPLDPAHIAAGQGTARRVEDTRAVNILCRAHHSLHQHHDGPPRKINNVLLPVITNGMMLWLKAERDPNIFNASFLEVIWVGPLPLAVPPPQVYLEEYERMRVKSWRPR